MPQRGKNYAPNWHTTVSKGAVRERKRASVGGPEVHLFARSELRPRHLKHWRVEVSGCHITLGGRKSHNFRVTIPIPAAGSSQCGRTAGHLPQPTWGSW